MRSYLLQHFVTRHRTVNLDKADEKGSRGVGESAGSGKMRLGGLMCLRNALSNVEASAAFHHF